MSQIFELFGYPLTDKSDEAEACRKSAMCPFMGDLCDGGGNRPQSNLSLAAHPALVTYFDDNVSATIPSGVCSLQVKSGQKPWIVCPRRLLFLGKSGGQDVSKRANQHFAESRLLAHSDFPAGTSVGVWSEVKVKYTTNDGDYEKSFDSTFDYVLVPLETLSRSEVEQITAVDWPILHPLLASAGYRISQHDGEIFVHHFPSGQPIIVEIMTSSTSGGNKRKRTTIPMAFEDAILGKRHNGPGINYRQASLL